MTEEEIQEFHDAVDALDELITSLWYAASQRDFAEYVVSELPSRGYKIVKMTPEEIEEWEGDWEDDVDEDIKIDTLVWDENPYLDRTVKHVNEEE